MLALLVPGVGMGGGGAPVAKGTGGTGALFYGDEEEIERVFFAKKKHNAEVLARREEEGISILSALDMLAEED